MLTKEEYMEIKEVLLEELETAVPERAEVIRLAIDEIKKAISDDTRISIVMV